MIEAIQIDPRTSQTDALQLLAAAAEPVRWKLLAELASRGTRCVCDLMPVGGVAPNVLSYHLRVLREAGLVTASKRGRWVDYSLAPDAHERLIRALPTAAPLTALAEPSVSGSSDCGR